MNFSFLFISFLLAFPLLLLQTHRPKSESRLGVHTASFCFRDRQKTHTKPKVMSESVNQMINTNTYNNEHSKKTWRTVQGKV